MSLEWIPRVEVGSDRGGTTFNFWLSFDSIVYGNGCSQRDQQEQTDYHLKYLISINREEKLNGHLVEVQLYNDSHGPAPTRSF